MLRFDSKSLPRVVGLVAAMTISVGLLRSQAIFLPFDVPGDCSVTARTALEIVQGSVVEWSWGDGSVTRATASEAQHRYAAEGEYTIGLVVGPGPTAQKFETTVSISPNPGSSCPAIPSPEAAPLPAPSQPVPEQPAPVAPVAVPPSCVSLPSEAFPVSHAGNTLRPLVRATSADCAWAAASDRDWAQVFPLSGKGTAAIAITVFPNFSSVPRYATVVVSGRPFRIVQEANLGTRDQRFVELLYFAFLGRLPSTSERDFQVTQGLRPPATYADLAATFFASPEFTLTGRFIAGLYVGLLQRDAEYGGWLFQRTALANKSVDHESQVRNFITSPEFVMKFGVLDDAGLVRLLYRGVLNREASQQEVDFQVGAIRKWNARGMDGRAAFGTSLLASDEFARRAGHRLTAFLLYATLLQHDVPDGDREGRIEQLSSGVTPKAIIAELIEDFEFMAVLN